MTTKRVFCILFFGLMLTACSNEGTYTGFDPGGDGGGDSKPPGPGLRGYTVIVNQELTPLAPIMELGQDATTGYHGYVGISSTAKKTTVASGYTIYQQTSF